MSNALLPDTRVSLMAPEPLLNDRAFLLLHNRVAKNALEGEAIYHWATRIPRHFEKGAAVKYGYMARKPGYIIAKKRRYGHAIPLVRTGATRDQITREVPQITIGGKAANSDGSSGQLRLTMKMQLPFGQAAQAAVARGIRTGRLPRNYTSGQNKPGVTIEQMKREIAAITLDEGKEIAAGFGMRYTKGLKYALKSRPKIRKRLAAAI